MRAAICRGVFFELSFFHWGDDHISMRVACILCPRFQLQLLRSSVRHAVASSDCHYGSVVPPCRSAYRAENIVRKQHSIRAHAQQYQNGPAPRRCCFSGAHSPLLLQTGEHERPANVGTYTSQLSPTWKAAGRVLQTLPLVPAARRLCGSTARSPSENHSRTPNSERQQQSRMASKNARRMVMQ